MKQSLIFCIVLFYLISPSISKGDKLSPKQVIEKYYQLMMNTDWSYDYAQGYSSVAGLVTNRFHTVPSSDDTLRVALSPRISNCKERKNKATCDVTYFIIGQWNNYDPFCERHYIVTATFKLIKKSGEWKINKTASVWLSKKQASDASQIVSISYILRTINGVIDADCAELKNKDSHGGYNKKIWHSKKEWLNRVKEEKENFQRAKETIKYIEKRALKYGIKNNEVFIEDKGVICPFKAPY